MLRHPWKRLRFSRVFHIPSGPRQLGPFRFASAAAEAQPAQLSRRRFVWGGAFTAVGLAAGAVSLDEGLRRCVEFWVVVLPIYLHYLYVDKVGNAEPGKARAEAFQRLHEGYSPVVERATLRLRGFYLKAAQVMSMRDDFLPPQYLVWTKKLQHEAPVVLSAEAARSCVCKELGLKGGLEEAFSEWQEEPIGSASIGQVYKARLRSSGDQVAVKVQSPGIERLFRSDIRTLKFFTSFALPWAVENMNAIERMFETEFDYALERQNLEAVRANVLPVWGAKVKIPRTYPALCSKHVLCMEFLEGEKLIDGLRRRFAAMAEREGRSSEAYEQDFAQALVARDARSMRWRTALWRCWRRLRFGDDVVDVAGIMETVMAVHGEQVLRDGLFNADPHPGNILLMADGRTIGLIDFGQVRGIALDFRLVLARLVVALARRDPAEVLRLEQKLGMKTKYARQDVRYRLCSFWLDRDGADIMGDMNLHDFMAWGEREDPVLFYPEDLYVVCRCSTMIRGLALAFGVRLSTAEYWRPHAERLLRQHGIEY